MKMKLSVLVVERAKAIGIVIRHDVIKKSTKVRYENFEGIVFELGEDAVSGTYGLTLSITDSYLSKTITLILAPVPNC